MTVATLLVLTALALTAYGDNITTTTLLPEPENIYECNPGFIPTWKPEDNISRTDRAARAIVYFLSLIYMFLGVSIIADRFMSSIEVITSKEKEVVITRKDGTNITMNVRIWNETVSNLTLMALGSSAPEIMLTAFEVISKYSQCHFSTVIFQAIYDSDFLVLLHSNSLPE